MRWLLVLLVLSGCRSAAPQPLRVAAAADLTEAFTELGARFEKETKTKVVFSFGSSGLLAKQIAEGAPFDVFAAANASFVEATVQAGACDGATAQTYARGRLAAWSLSGPLPSIESIADASNQRIALANPEHAPYGKAAREALENAGLWTQLASRVVFAENVRQALQLAQTGNAEVALVAYSNVVNRKDGVRLLIDEALYTPIEQSLVRCSRGGQGEAAKRFVDFLGTNESQELMKRSGFLLEPVASAQ